MLRKLVVMVVVGVALLAMVPDAEADRRRGGYRSGHGYRPGGGGFVGRSYGPRVYFGFGGYPYWGGYYPRYYSGYYGGYPYPYGYSPPAVYTAPPPVVYAPPPVVAPAPAAPDYQREVVYPHGKYVLEGDGVSTAYHWTWIPSAAPPPPPPVEPTN